VAGERFRHSSGRFEQCVRTGPGLMLDAHRLLSAISRSTSLMAVPHQFTPDRQNAAIPDVYIALTNNVSRFTNLTQ